MQRFSLKDVCDNAGFNNKMCKQNEFPATGTAEVKNILQTKEECCKPVKDQWCNNVAIVMETWSPCIIK